MIHNIAVLNDGTAPVTLTSLTIQVLSGDVEPVAHEHRADVGNAQRLRPHARAARAGTDVGRRADQADESVHAAATD